MQLSRSSRSTIWLMLFITLPGVAASGRQADRFDSVTIKIAAPRTNRVVQGPNDYYRNGINVRGLIMYAYQVSIPRVFDGPEWIDSVPWEVDARSSRTIGSDAQRRQMVRQLLVDYFGLRARTERRTIPGFALTTVRHDAPGLWPADPDCKHFKNVEFIDTTGGTCEPPTFTLKGGRTTWRRHNLTRSGLVFELENVLDQLLVDETQQSGPVDVELLMPAGWGPGHDPNVRELLDAIEMQLGLGAEPRQLFAEVLVIEQVNQPRQR